MREETATSPVQTRGGASAKKIRCLKIIFYLYLLEPAKRCYLRAFARKNPFISWLGLIRPFKSGLKRVGASTYPGLELMN
ncbi:hypothetical protein ACSQ67_004182 [Phaseolus vulgaris]